MIIFKPRKIKFRKFQRSKGVLRGGDNQFLVPRIGCFGVKALSSYLLNFRHVEAIRILVNRRVKKSFKTQIKINVSPTHSVSKKSAGLRMGKGKAAILHWVFPVRVGRILFELGPNVPKPLAKSIFKLACTKLPGRNTVVYLKNFRSRAHEVSYFYKKKR